MTEGPDVPIEDAKPKRTADNNDLFLLDECCAYARTMIKKLQALDRPDKVTAIFVEIMETVEEGLEADMDLRRLNNDRLRWKL